VKEELDAFHFQCASIERPAANQVEFLKKLMMRFVEDVKGAFPLRKLAGSPLRVNAWQFHAKLWMRETVRSG